MSQTLDVYLKDELAGYLSQESGGDLTFTYDGGYLDANSPDISIALPLQQQEIKGTHVKAFFSGLLPDENVRKKLAAILGLSEGNAFSLLEAVGGDCAGALALYPHGQKPSDIIEGVEILSDARLAETLDLIKHRPMLAGDDGYRLSLAGAQDKLAIGFKNGKIHLIKGGGATTHILKPIIEGVSDSAHNELFCMRLAKHMGIDAPEVALHFLGETPYYLVDRYDRKIDGSGKINRIHQEDFCQAMGIMPESKYEREGGPKIESCQAIIAKHSAKPAVDQIKFLNMIIFNYLIGNTDAHGKNFSLLYTGKKPELAPAYDLLCTAIYPNLSEKMAMKIGGKYKPRDIYRRRFYKLVPDTKSAQATMDKQITKMTGSIIDTAEKLKSDLESDGLNSDVFDKIIKVINERCKNI